MAQLASELRVTQQQVQKYESGQNKLSVYTLEQCAVILRVSVTQLLEEQSDWKAERKEWLILWDRLESKQKRVLAYRLGEAVATEV